MPEALARSKGALGAVILLGIGANLPTARFGPPLAGCAAALKLLPEYGIAVVRRSRWYCTAPVPPSDQPDFINAVAEIAATAEPGPLLQALHAVEVRFGRDRGPRNAARVLDLDLLAYGDRVSAPGAEVALPHPRMHERPFVLVPLAELAPRWRHPRLGLRAGDLLARIAEADAVVAVEDPNEPVPATSRPAKTGRAFEAGD